MMNMKNWIAALTLSLACAVSAFAGAGVDINQADASTLASELKGIGMSKAEAIVAYREQHGPFKTAEELTQVKGIGTKTVEQNKGLIVISEATSKDAAPKDEAPKDSTTTN